MFEGYFLGLAEGQTLRNMALISAGIGFAPAAAAAWLLHSNHYLWLALLLFSATRMVTLGTQLPRTFRDFSEGEPLIEGSSMLSTSDP
jgi:MATE family multidrug resistance protein